MHTPNAAAERDRLVQGCAALGVPLEAADPDRLLAYLEQLYTWNSSASLTTVPRSQALRLHLLDSLAAAQSLAPLGSVADLGSGGGLPGLPLAVVRPGARFSLIERRRRRCSFLSAAARTLHCDNVEVVNAVVADLPDQTFDCVISRAFRDPQTFVNAAYRLLQPGGRVVVMAARLEERLPAALAASQEDLEVVEDGAFTLPGGDEARRILVLQRSG